MRIVLSCVFAGLALGFAAAPQASAQYPIYAPPSYGPFVQQPSHHSHHCLPPPTQYYSGYNASGYGASGYQYPPSLGYPAAYGAGAILAQPVAPPSPIYYSNSNYYSVPSAHRHHGWHPGHYLLGHY